MSDTELARVGGAAIDLIASAYPPVATLLGIHEYDGELGSYTESPMADFAAALRGVRSDVVGLAESELSPVARIDQRFLVHLIDSSLLEVEGTQWWRRNPDEAVELALTGVFFLMLREFAPAEVRARSTTERLDKLPAYLADARRTLSDTPRVLTETAIVSAEAGAEFLGDALPQWAAELGRSGRALAASAVAGAAALRVHAAWLRDEYLPRSTGPVGVGEDLLARIIATKHMLTDSPDEIARRGEEMIARLTESITEAAKELGFAEWRAAVADVRKDVPAPDELIAAYEDAMRWTERVVRERGLASAVEGAALDVRETPPFWRHTTPYAAYTSPGPFEEDQRGIFWVTPPDGDLEKLKGHPRPSIVVVALHEGFPGHHLQLTRANRHPSRIRRLGDSSLLVEGWAFYCEEMAHEQGLLSPEARLCQLKDELWRAWRIVIDVRLHQGRMSPAEAVEMLVREADLERPNAEAEVRRYTYTPGYQMSYAIGKQELLRLRERVKAAEGADFSLPRFHDRVLDEGSIPTPLIAEALFPGR